MTELEFEYYTQYIHELRIRYIAIVDTAIQTGLKLSDIKEGLEKIGLRIEYCRKILGHEDIQIVYKK